MSGTVLLGYDVETASDSTAGFLDGAAELHTKYDVPWSIYLVGSTVEARVDDILRHKDDPLLTIGQHTYSHMLLKSIYMTPRDGKEIHGGAQTYFKAGGPLDEVEAEITKTQKIIRDLLGIECEGLTGPWGYYRGLADREDILRVLHENGIRWIRTNARDSRDCQPVPFTEQPYFYEQQGFPDILELGIQGYQDDFYWERFDDRRHGDTYQDYLYATLEEIAANDWVWNLCSHDHGTFTAEMFHQTKGKWLSDFISRGKKLGVRFASPTQVYAEMHAAREAATG